MSMLPIIEWKDDHIRILDQRKLPLKKEYYLCRSPKEVLSAIRKMVIRGAPAIGIAAGMGIALGALKSRAKTTAKLIEDLKKVGNILKSARPTAYNLQWAVNRILNLAEERDYLPPDKMKEVIINEALSILEEDIERNKRIGHFGKELIPDDATVLTHCNAGALATGGYGTALGVIRSAVESGKRVKVLADETRPWLQGLRLTSFELMEDGIPVEIITDNSAGSMMRLGKVDVVITGADRIAKNGDTANKIGTYQLAVLAKENRIPFFIAAPTSTIDPNIKSGDEIEIEFRDQDEIRKIGNKRIVGDDVKALNPAFDITPARYISGIITEKGIIGPPYVKGINQIINQI